MTEKELRAEWQALRERVYAEEGIAMILGVETVGSEASKTGEPEVADEFRALATTLAPIADGASPAEIIEVVAARALRRLG